MPACICPLSEAARDAPNLPALIDKDISLTFSELDSLANDFAARLYQLGIRHSHRISLIHPPDWRLIPLFFAIWRLGAIACPLNTRLPPSQIASCLSRLSPHLHITNLDSFFGGAGGAPSSPSLTCSALRKSPGLSRDSAASTNLAFSIYHLAFLLFTSGSTAAPKIAALSHSNLLANAHAAVPALDLKPGDRWLLSLPLYHVGGIGIVLRCVIARAAIILDPRNPSVTHLSYVPAQLYKSWPVYKNLRCLLLGGAPIGSYPDSLPVYATYGLTEMGSIVTATFKPHGSELYLGHPLAGREIRIASDGEILVKGECLFQGYWENGSLHLPLHSDGWFATRDLGRLEKEGLIVIGRKDWQFISGGENIQPEEIEQELLKLPQIEEAVVVPLDDPEFGKRPCAVVRLNDPSYDLTQMQRDLSANLPKYKIPIALVPLDEFPKASLKTDRKKIFQLVDKKDFI